MPAWRHGVALVAALTVGFLALFCWFDHDIEDKRRAAQPENWTARVQTLRAEDEQQRAVLEKALPTVDADPEIISLRNTLDQARRDYPKVRDEVVCEADGTCGSRKEGRRENYEEKVRRRDQLKADIEVNLPGEISRRTAAVDAKIDAAERAKKDAESRRDDISSILGAPPTWSNRWDALNEVASAQWKVALAVALAAGLTHFVLDALPLQGTARRICSRRPRSEPAVQDSPETRDAGAEEPGGVPARGPEPAGASRSDGGGYRVDFDSGMWLPSPSDPGVRPSRRWWWRKAKW